MPQTPVSVSAFISSATPSTVYTVGAGKTAIINNVQVASLLGSTVNVTLNKVATDGTVYPIAVDRRSGDDVNYWTSSNSATSPLNVLKGSITLGAGESLSLSTSTSASFKFPQTYTGNGILNQVTYGGGRYVVVGRNDDNSKGLVLTSTDGQNWTRQTFTFSFTLNDVAAATGRIVAISGQYTTGYFTSTDDGVTWTQVAGLSGGHSGAPTGIAYLNSTWIIYGSNYIYTSSDGATWTLNSALTAYLGGFNPTLKNVTWDGTRFIFATQNGMIHANSGLNSFSSPGHIRGGLVPQSIAYHSASGKFFGALAYSNAANYLVSSTDGLNWTNENITTSFTSGGYPVTVVCGSQTSQTVLLQSAADRKTGIYSTNSGSTWTAYTNNNVTRPLAMVGLGNGYFLHFGLESYSQWIDCCTLISGDYYGYVAIGQTPWTMGQTGTGASYSGYQVDTWDSKTASSTNTANGAWVVFGVRYSSGSNIWHHWRAAGSDGWSGSSTFMRTSSYTTSPYGVPVASAFFNNKFWMITNNGYLFSLDNTQGANLVYVTRVCNGSNGISVVNNRLCVTCTNTAQAPRTIFFSTDGTNWVGTTVQNTGAYPASVTSNGIISSGTNAVMINSIGQIAQSSDGEGWVSIPSAFVQVSNLNNNLFGQTSTRDSNFNNVGYGTYYISNPTTVAGFTKISASSRSYAETMANMMIYANSSYFFVNPLALLSSPTATFSAAGVASNAVNGQTFMSAYNYYAAATSGSGAVIIDARSTEPTPVYKIGYVTNVNFARSVASVGISILEIS